MRPLAWFFARILKTKRSTRDRHANDFPIKRAWLKD
jgi:hypothetical protein